MADQPDGPVALFAFVKRRADMTHEEFLDYWHNQHGPFIRETPGLGDLVSSYEQHPARADDRSGFDGVAVQRFASWDDFVAMISSPVGEEMREDEKKFLDQSEIKVVFTDAPTVVVGPDRAS